MTADRRTLTDELNSVLIEHSLEAPEPTASIEAVLSRVATLPVPAGGTGRRRVRWSRQLNGWLVAATVLGLCGTGVVALGSGGTESHSASTAKGAPSMASAAAAASGSATDAAATGAPSAAAQAPASAPAGCVPAGDGATVLTVKGATFNVVESYCAAEQASQVQVTAHENAQTRVVSTLISPDQHLLVQSVTVNGARLTVTAMPAPETSSGGVAAGSAAPTKAASAPQSDNRLAPTSGPAVAAGLQALTFTTADGTRFVAALPRLIAPACTAAQLALTVSAVNAKSPLPVRVTVTNRSRADCALSGYPTLFTIGSPSGFAGSQTLVGPAGGVRNQQYPPVVTLSSGEFATALVESYRGGAGQPAQNCSPTSTLQVSLDSTGPLAPVNYAIATCTFLVHPFVAGTSGTSG